LTVDSGVTLTVNGNLVNIGKYHRQWWN